MLNYLGIQKNVSAFRLITNNFPQQVKFSYIKVKILPRGRRNPIFLMIFNNNAIFLQGKSPIAWMHFKGIFTST